MDLSDLSLMAARRPVDLRPGVPPLLTLFSIGKFFPSVIANKDVTIDFYPGEIHALLGENGAGKSTLMNVVTGLYQPDEGELILDGYGVTFESPEAAIAAGIGMVHQHFKLVSRFTVAENLALGWDKTSFFVSARKLEQRAVELSNRFGLKTCPSARIDMLTAGEQQRVEILRVLSRGARLLILDEPTAVLSPLEVEDLYAALRRFRNHGGAVILISHKLDEIMALADRVSVLRHGRLTGTHAIAGTSPMDLVTEMIGRPVEQKSNYPRDTPRLQDNVVLCLENVSCRDSAGSRRLTEVSLELKQGEILGVAGVTGNGQTELADLMSGLRSPDAGKVILLGQDVTGKNPDWFRKAGIGYVPEDRLHQALAPALSVQDNAVMRVFRHAPVGGTFAFHEMEARRFTQRLLDASAVSVPSVATPIRGLSGGNQQRVVVARERQVATLALIASYPSRGLDIGAISGMRTDLAAIRDEGKAVMLISEDLDEIMALSDRIAVLCGGRLMAVLSRSEKTRDEIGALMSGRQQGGRA